jgi:hypothetical protein
MVPYVNASHIFVTDSELYSFSFGRTYEPGFDVKMDHKAQFF